MAQKLGKIAPKSAVETTTKAPEPRELQIPAAVRSCVESLADGRLGANKNRYKVIESTSDRLLRELSKLNTTERRHFGENLQDFERSLGDIKIIAFYLAAAPRPRHRPRDSVKYPHISRHRRD